ncbi:hypothetical protein X947_4612 [Burkholderia pseudomallei MSHR7334]|nr:hypothetical protein X947_4612 [Burkholderia pseudomallei MSHR7334]
MHAHLSAPRALVKGATVFVTEPAIIPPMPDADAAPPVGTCEKPREAVSPVRT